MRTELKPCPFCGSESRTVAARAGEDCMITWAECSGCLARTDEIEDAYSDHLGAADLWNRRAA